ncbi:MAG: DUF721 domain-containing protein [FCB group bacterium]|nr:DUF721 domain-containing protein [FCB group bacterium]
MFQQLKELINTYFEENKIDTSEEQVRAAWHKTIGKPILQNTEIFGFSNQILTVKALNPVWRNELSLRKDELLQNLKRELKLIKIKDIRFI